MADRDDLAAALAVTSVHHPMFCDCDGDVRCDGLEEQVDAILAAGWVHTRAKPCGCVWCCQATNPWIRGEGHRHCAGHPIDVALDAAASDPASQERADEAFERDVLASEAADREVP